MFGNGLHEEFSSKPRFITDHILPLATFIIRVAIGRGVECIKTIAYLNVELYIPSLPLVVGSK